MLIIIVALAAGTAQPVKVNYAVELSGKRYRVETRGDVVRVFSKAGLTGRSPERGAALRAAVREATKCEIKEEYWEGAHLAGVLSCPAGVNPPVPAK